MSISLVRLQTCLLLGVPWMRDPFLQGCRYETVSENCIGVSEHETSINICSTWFNKHYRNIKSLRDLKKR